MPLDKKTWLQDITGKAAAQKTADAREKQKQAVLSQLTADMTNMADQQTKNWNIELAAGKKKQKMLDYDNRDQTEEFDLDEIQDGFGVQSDDDLLKLAGALNTTEQWVQKLKNMKDPSKPKIKVKKTNQFGIEEEVEEEAPLFDEKEIAAELYQPLVRRGMLPETFVPDQFSQTKEMIEGSFDEYKKRLKSEEQKSWVDENFSLVMAGVGMVTAVGSAGATFDKIGQGLSADDLAATKTNFTDGGGTGRMHDAYSTNLKEISGDYARHAGQVANDFSFAGTVTGLAGNVYDANTDRKDIQSDRMSAKEPGAARLANLPKLGQGMSACLSAHLASAFKESGLAMTASSALGTLVKPAAVGTLLKGVEEGDPKKNVLKEAHTQKVVDLLSGALEDVMKVCAQTLKDTDDKQRNAKAKILDAGGKMKTAFKGICTADALLKALEESDGKLDPGKAIALVARAGAKAVEAGAVVVVDVFKDDDLVKSMHDGMEEKMIEEVKKENQALDVAAKKEKEEWDAIAKKADAGEMASLIEKKTAELKETAKIIKWAGTFAGLGIAQAALAFGPMAIAGSGVKIIQNIYFAVKRHRDWYNFAKDRMDMFKAASAYSAAVSNFVSNSRLQALHYDFTAAMEGANVIGAVLQCTGVASAAGIGLQAAVSAAEAIENFLMEAKKRLNLETAWQQYRLALSRPANRKLALLAMKQNPTLAKYAVAYGAVIKRDPLVSNFMQSCDLDEKTLKDPRAKCDKVVSYLEARMPDDISVVGRTVDLHDWAPATVELTLACWSSAKKRGEQMADLKKGQDTSAIEAALARLDAIFEDAKKKHKATPADVATKELVVECKEVLDAVESAFRGFHPRMLPKDGKEIEHGPMLNLLKEFQKKVQECRKELA